MGLLEDDETCSDCYELFVRNSSLVAILNKKYKFRNEIYNEIPFRQLKKDFPIHLQQHLVFIPIYSKDLSFKFVYIFKFFSPDPLR